MYIRLAVREREREREVDNKELELTFCLKTEKELFLQKNIGSNSFLLKAAAAAKFVADNSTKRFKKKAASQRFYS